MGSIIGTVFQVATWGESHGKGLGVVIDGCPAGIPLSTEDIQKQMDKRKPGNAPFSTKRKESDTVQILSGVFEGVTTGTPISMAVFNEDQNSKDYSAIANVFRPGHADYSFYQKYHIRDYRGGGRSSGRETLSRVAAGAVALKILNALGITLQAYTLSIGPVEINPNAMNFSTANHLMMPDEKAYEKACAYLKDIMEKKDSAGGVIECVVKGMPPGIGQTVFDKLDADLAKAIFSIGGVKGFEIGSGFEAAKLTGSQNNDPMDPEKGFLQNNAGGILGGMSSGADIIFRAAFKPTPSIAAKQKTVDIQRNATELEIHGRHDPVIVPRAVVVVESMAAIILADHLLRNMHATIDGVKQFYR